MSSHEIGKAELAFREAFDRLKCGRSKILPSGSKVSQNNVAREAGRDPSALKKARFPRLIEEIQRWGEEFGNTGTTNVPSKLRSQRNKNRTLREQIQALKEQRDHALSLLLEADAKILELSIENRRLLALKQTANILNLSKKPRA